MPDDTPPPDDSRVAPSALDELGPLDVDGVGAARWGTVAWGMALIVTVLLRDRLATADALWWIAVCVAGFLGGLVGWWYLVRRRDAIRRSAPEPTAGA